jgi:hypothetical protein
MNDAGLQLLDFSKFCESSSLTERQQKSRSLREYRILSANIAAFMYVIAVPETWKVCISFYVFLCEFNICIGASKEEHRVMVSENKVPRKYLYQIVKST